MRGKQAFFLTNIEQPHGMFDDPLWYVLEITRKDNEVMNSYLSEVIKRQDYLRASVGR